MRLLAIVSCLFVVISCKENIASKKKDEPPKKQETETYYEKIYVSDTACLRYRKRNNRTPNEKKFRDMLQKYADSLHKENIRPTYSFAEVVNDSIPGFSFGLDFNRQFKKGNWDSFRQECERVYLDIEKHLFPFIKCSSTTVVLISPDCSIYFSGYFNTQKNSTKVFFDCEEKRTRSIN